MKFHQRKNWILAGAVLTLVLTGCDWFSNAPDFEDDFITYVIRPGNHEAENTTASLQLQTSYTLDFQAIFDESARYTTSNPGNVYDINKLLGFSDCGLHHHGASARIGWNYMDGEVRIYTYVYSNGERIPEQFLGVAEIGKIHRYKIEIQGDQYKFSMDDRVEYVPRKCEANPVVPLPSYRLFPYFGGDELAPHEIRIKVRML
jgi:hypothetical protein